MKNWLKFTAALIIGAFIFTACETEVTLTVPGDATIDLGDDFDPKAGVTVDGAKLEDVQVLWNPAWNNELVDLYVASYSVEGETAQRNVYVRADKLTGNYAVTEVDNTGTFGPYPMNVTRGTEFNELRFNELFFDDIIVNGVINGAVITIPSQNFFSNNVTIQATGSYDGAGHKILELDYTIDYYGDEIVGKATFTR